MAEKPNLICVHLKNACHSQSFLENGSSLVFYHWKYWCWSQVSSKLLSINQRLIMLMMTERSLFHSTRVCLAITTIIPWNKTQLRLRKVAELWCIYFIAGIILTISILFLFLYQQGQPIMMLLHHFYVEKYFTLNWRN